MNDFLVYRSSDKAPKKLFFMLHGSGGTAKDIISLAPMIKNSSKEQDFVVIAPNARISSSEKECGLQWFEIEKYYKPELFEKEPNSLSLEEKQAFYNMSKGISKESDRLNDILDYCQELFGLEDKDSVVLGYSQGAMMAIDMTLSRKSPVSAVVSVAGAVVPPFLEEQKQRQVSSPDFLILHGCKDKVVNYNSSEYTKNLLVKMGLKGKKIGLKGMSHGRDENKSEKHFWETALKEINKYLSKSKTSKLVCIYKRGKHR